MYHVVYDISERALPLWIGGVAFGCAAIGGVCIMTRYVRAGVGAFLAAVLLGAAFVWQSYQLIHLRQLLQAGETEIVEGRVRDFHPMKLGGHGSEQFCVGTKCFVYTGASAPGFNQPRVYGGPLEEGLFVRIHFVGNAILRLEVK